MRRLLKTEERFEIEISILCLAILLYLSRTAIPFFKFPFILIYLGFIIYTLYTFNSQLFRKIKKFSRVYSLLLILAAILIISFILSDKLYLTIFKDVFNAIVLLSFYFLLSVFITKRNDLNTFTVIFLKLITLFAFVISVNGLASFFNIFSIGEGISSRGIPSESTDGFLSIDANFAQLIVFFGIIGLIYKLTETRSVFQIFLINLLLTLFSINIFFSGSRRGLLTLICIIVFLIIAQLLSFFKEIHFLKKIASTSWYYLVSLVFLMVFSSCFISCTSFTLKNRILEFIGSKNPEKVRRDITFVILRYSEGINIKSTFSDIYKLIWTPNLNPHDPDSGWGTRIHKTIYPLAGKNVEIVPAGSKGYLMDKSCNSDTRAGNAYSYTTISNETVTKNNTLTASVFCYVSNDFNGEWALLSCEGSTIGEKEDKYDLTLKGTWQRLKIEVNCLDGNAPVYLYFSKFGVTDFSSLNGYVIFAFPEVEIHKKMINGLSKSENTFSLVPKDDTLNEVRKISYSNSQSGISKIQIIKKRFSLILVGKIKNDKKVGIINNKGFPNYLHEGSFYNSLLIISLISGQLNSDDPVRKWVSDIIAEDTVYHGYVNSITLDTISNEFLSSRILRWQFAWQIFIKEFSLKQKVFGGGFNFLNWFGYYFLKDKTLSDYPHNPFFSILLYSGIFGLILYIFLLYKVFYYYIKYLKEYFLFLIFFLITFFFSFFSAGSPFDPPIMGFFMLWPFFVNSIRKNEDHQILQETLKND